MALVSRIGSEAGGDKIRSRSRSRSTVQILLLAARREVRFFLRTACASHHWTTRQIKNVKKREILRRACCAVPRGAVGKVSSLNSPLRPNRLPAAVAIRPVGRRGGGAGGRGRIGGAWGRRRRWRRRRDARPPSPRPSPCRPRSVVFPSHRALFSNAATAAAARQKPNLRAPPRLPAGWLPARLTRPRPFLGCPSVCISCPRKVRQSRPRRACALPALLHCCTACYDAHTATHCHRGPQQQ